MSVVGYDDYVFFYLTCGWFLFELQSLVLLFEFRKVAREARARAATSDTLELAERSEAEMVTNVSDEVEDEANDEIEVGARPQCRG